MLGEIFGGKPVEQKVIGQDEELSKIMSEQAKRAQESEEDVAKRQTEGLEKEGQFIKGSSIPHYMGKTGEDIDKALQERSQRKFEEDVLGLKQEAKKGARSSQLQRQQQSIQNLTHRDNVRYNAYNIRMDNELRKIQSRNAMLGQVMGLAGQVAGMALGGPAGAAIMGAGTTNNAQLNSNVQSQTMSLNQQQQQKQQTQVASRRQQTSSKAQPMQMYQRTSEV